MTVQELYNGTSTLFRYNCGFLVAMKRQSFIPQRGHDNMDHFIPKQLLDFDISSNRDLLKIFHSYCRDMGIFNHDCDEIGILNADVNIYLRLMKVINNCFWNGIGD